MMETPNSIIPRSTTPSRPIIFLVAGVVIFLVGAITGVYASPYFPFSSSGGNVNANNTYQAGFDAAKALVENSSVGAIFRTPNDVRTLQGTVTAMSGNQLTLHLRSMNPFDDPLLVDRIVLVTTSTTVTRLTQKDPKTYQTEMNAFAKAIQTGISVSQTMVPPEPFTSISASITDIAVGDVVTVTATENIKTMKTFQVSKIQVQERITAPI